jgi:hypothetical protein
MLKTIAALVAVCGLGAVPAYATERQQPQSGPARLSDGELDQVKGGELLSLGVLAPINLQLGAITVNVPVNAAAVVQANLGGTGSFQGLALGTQNNFYFPPLAIPGG